jgi:hypothetical protein
LVRQGTLEISTVLEEALSIAVLRGIVDHAMHPELDAEVLPRLVWMEEEQLF